MINCKFKMKIKTIVLLFLVIFLLKDNFVFCQTNNFKIGIFGFEFMYNDTSYNCSDLDYAPLTSLLLPSPDTNCPTSQGNVLCSDGFNIVTTSLPNVYASSPYFMTKLLQLLKDNGLQFMTLARQYYKPINENGINIYDFAQNPSSICQARPNFDNLFSSNVYANNLLKNTVWGHQVTEEASAQHFFNPTDNFVDWNDSINNMMTEVPPQNVSDAIGHFRQRENSLGIRNQKLVVMEANHGKAIWDSVIEVPYPNGSANNFQPCDYLKMPNVENTKLPDVFFEGSYFKFPLNDIWLSQTYTNMFTNNGNFSYHYLGGQKSIDWAYNYVNEVHDVISTEINAEGGEQSFHSNLNIKNANWLWFQAYTSIIHGAKGIWFWDLANSWQDNETKPDGKNRFIADSFPNAYKQYIRHLARELSYLVRKNLINTDTSTIITTKKDIADPNNIIKNLSYTWPNNISNEQKAEHETDNYSLRYTIRQYNDEAIMIITNPLNCKVKADLDFTNYTNDLIRNSTNYKILFESSFPSDDTVTSSTYKLDRCSTINLDLNNLSVGKYYNSSNFNGLINGLAFGPVDVHIIKFGPINNQWFDEIRDKSSNILQLKSEIKYDQSNNNIYYVKSDGTLCYINQTNKIGITHCLNQNAPKILQGTGLGIDVNANNLYYASSSNKKVYKISYFENNEQTDNLNNQQNICQFEQIDKTNNNVRSDSRIIYRNGDIFYVNEEGILNVIYKYNGVWETGGLNTSNSPVKTGIGITIAPNWNDPIYYQGNDGKIYCVLWDSIWKISTIYNSNINIRQNSELHYGNGQIFFIQNDGVLHALYKNGSVWTYDWLNGNAPKVKAGTDFALSTDNAINTIYYIAEDDFLYKFSWTNQNGWQASKISPTSLIKGRDSVDVFYSNGNIYYGGSDTKIHAMYYKNTNTTKNANSFNNEIFISSAENTPMIKNTEYNNINIYPNPTNKEINIEYELKNSSNVEMSLYNISGQKIKNIDIKNCLKGKNVNKIDASNLNNGIYILRIIANNDILKDQKIIIQK